MYVFILFFLLFFFFNDTATTEIYTLSLHDALPISRRGALEAGCAAGQTLAPTAAARATTGQQYRSPRTRSSRSEEHTSELQSRLHLVCRLLLEKKKKNTQEKRACILENICTA